MQGFLDSLVVARDGEQEHTRGVRWLASMLLPILNSPLRQHITLRKLYL